MHTKFDSEIIVRPSEIDLNRHVHQSVYLDYVLFARWDQMKRCYKVSMEELFKRGFSWATKSTHFEFNKPLYLGDEIIVRTWVEEIRRKSLKVCFQILKKGTEEIASEGYFVYVLINAKSGNPENIPEDIIKLYSV